MKKTLLISISAAALLLSGCFGNGSSETIESKKTIDGFQMIETGEFTVQIPEGWATLSTTDFKSGAPKNTIAAFRSNVRDPKFTPNVVIIKNEVAEGVVPLDYAKALRQKVGDELGAFKEIKMEETEGTLFIYVEGRESDDADLKRFMQLPHIKGKEAYIAVGSFLASADEPTSEIIEKAVRSFVVK